MKRYVELMKTEVKLEDVTCAAKEFFKTYSSFHLVTARDGAKSTCSCTGYYQDLACEHATLMDMIHDHSFQIPEKFVEECAAFRRRAGRRKGGQKEDEEPIKNKDWDVMICGDWEESDHSKTLPRREFHKFVDERVASLTLDRKRIVIRRRSDE